MNEYEITASLADGRIIKVIFKASSDIEGIDLNRCALDSLKKCLMLKSIMPEKVIQWDYYKHEN